MIPRQGPRPCLHARRAIELGRGGRGGKPGRVRLHARGAPSRLGRAAQLLV